MQYHHPNKTLRMGVLVFICMVATLLSTSHADLNHIKMMGRRSAAVSADPTKINCLSFRLGVEADNLRDWATIPSYCMNYLKSYYEGKQYGLDVEATVGAAYKYLESLGEAGKYDIWIFDVEETLLTNKFYLNSSEFQYGAKAVNMTTYYEYLKRSPAEEVAAVFELYQQVFSWGYKIFLISGAHESLRNDLVELLEYPGYDYYVKLILKGDKDNGKSVGQYKAEARKQLEEESGWNIVGNVGDQWSDLSGENAGARTFKIPNPFYYIP